MSFMEIIDDCHHDFWIIQGSNRRDKSRRQAIEAIDLARQKFSELIGALGDAKTFVDIEYNNLRRLVFEESHLSQSPHMNFDNLVVEIKFAYGVIDLCAIRAREDGEFLILSDSKFRTHVVETAYTMSLYYSGPPFRTTPGSNFSACASVLFEIVSGKSDVSLAGAINRFARSKEKQGHDNYNAESEGNDDVALQSNNFRSVNLPIIQLANEYIRYTNMPGVPTSSSEAKMVVWKLWQRMISLSEDSKKKFGPFVENTEINPSLDAKDRIKEYDRLRLEMKKLVISLGRSRREDPADD
ncbi:hypothetical protein [Methylobacterium sp. WL9]|uniref:hypothetical protein n=1 Tax=Methylobacterium sp. WL9 TaxID=2603898 RepID=UPI001AEE971F|nr:hypothetical protein [Methylobacterium sp. WL9]